MASLHTQRRKQQQQQDHDQRQQQQQQQQQQHQIRRGHRRRHRRRRRFLYRKEAQWLVISILILLFLLAISYGINTTINDQDLRDFLIFISIIIAVFVAIIRIWKKLSCYNNRLVSLSLPMVPSSSSSSSTTSLWKTILLSPIYFSFRIKNSLLRRWSMMRDIYRGTSNNILYIAETATSAIYPIRTTMTITETLENFNQERLIRGESTVSTESIIAYERFMRDLADAVVVATDTVGNNNLIINIGVKEEQIEVLCPRWTILSTTANTHHNCLMQTECGICLDEYEEEQEEGVVYADNNNDDGKEENNNHQGKNNNNNTIVRTLPCRHIYHSRCIDQWLQRSKFCPTCKRSVLLPPLPPPTSTSTSALTSITSCRQ
jgi:hypothetical protein